ncbi:hypothetical protein ACFOOK_15650 [Micromonospora krabiensis]|nr:hypothetical protein [Micromonospora krabiensis]
MRSADGFRPVKVISNDALIASAQAVLDPPLRRATARRAGASAR